jgi:SOS-response transcriptional repressor LexA
MAITYQTGIASATAKNTVLVFEYDALRHYRPAMHKLRELRDGLGLSQQALADLAGTSQPQIRRLEAGERKLTKEWAERLAPHLQVEAVALLFSDSDDAEREVIGLPVLGRSRAGDWLDISIMDDSGEPEVIHVAKDPRFPRARQYALHVIGDSMDLHFPDGCYVTVVDFDETGLSLRKGMIVHVERHMGGTTLVETTLKMVGDDVKSLLPQSRNPVHKPIPLKGDDATEVIVKGIVTGMFNPVTF